MAKGGSSFLQPFVDLFWILVTLGVIGFVVMVCLAVVAGR